MTSALIVDAVVVFAVLKANLGSHRKVGRVPPLLPFCLAPHGRLLTTGVARCQRIRCTCSARENPSSLA
jgi:hypothetical protein